MSRFRSADRIATVAAIAALAIAAAVASDTVPTDIQQPGTQPGEVTAFATNCDTCHADTVNPALEPSHGWRGGMMANATRDPIFWATVAIAEQDFLPNPVVADRGGAGDLCLRCHGPGAWLGGRSTPTNGSAFTGVDERSVECEFCHLMVNPDQAVSTPGTVEEQNSPFLAYDSTTGEGYYGSAQFVLNSEGTRLGPYAETSANHQFSQSAFQRSGDFCGTCHDVSNAAVGDLAPNHGAFTPLDPGTFSGVPGGAIEDKAAFNNPPYAYGIVERTFSEWKASGLDTFRVEEFSSLPPELQIAGGSLEVAYTRALQSTDPIDADYADGTPRYFTCQTCHMAASVGKGCNKNNAPTRTDLPRHDQTGGQYWMPQAMAWQADNGTLRFGTLDAVQRAALTDGMARAEAHLSSAASVEAYQEGDQVEVKVTNLTGHKLISGYPEGRRMWLNLRWFDATDTLIEESGAYGPIGRTAPDRNGVQMPVESIVDLDSAIVYEAEMGMDAGWAAALVSLGYDPDMPLAFDRDTDAVEITLGQFAAQPADDLHHTFHFVINNRMIHDNRIPPYGMSYDVAVERNVTPIPPSQYGSPTSGGVYDHHDEQYFAIPPGATRVEVRLLYQQTSWEYIQFLWLANDGLDPFLGQEGINMLDAWLHTGMSPPHEMASATMELSGLVGTPGEASHQDVPSDLLLADYDRAGDQLQLTFTPACDATDHTLYVGDLAQVSSYGWTDAACFLGTSGSASVAAPPGSVFFVVVGSDGAAEGSYGRSSLGLERPEDVGTPVCDAAQDLGSIVCE